MSITLKEITKLNWEECVRLSVQKGQEHFVAPNIYSILQSKYEPDKVPLAIYNEETMVGFLMYGRDPEDGRYWFLRIMIDKNHQRNGYGRSALQQVINLIKNKPDCSRDLTVGFKPDNEAAEKLYKSLGFEIEGLVGKQKNSQEVLARLQLYEDNPLICIEGQEKYTLSGNSLNKELKSTNPFLDCEDPRPLGPGSYEMALPLINSTKIIKGMRVLEVGAGTGQVAATLAKHWDVTVITLEPSGKLGQTRTHAARLGVLNQVLPLKVKAQSMPFSKDAFDAVISIGSFEMIGEDRPQALVEMIRVARPGARIGIAEPMCLVENVPYDVNEKLKETMKGFKECYRTLDWNSNLFQQHGLKITEKYYFSDAYQWWQVYRDQKRVSKEEQELITLDSGRWLSLGIVVGEKIE
jgi:diamine N-acetyltransferase